MICGVLPLYEGKACVARTDNPRSGFLYVACAPVGYTLSPNQLKNLTSGGEDEFFKIIASLQGRVLYYNIHNCLVYSFFPEELIFCKAF